MSDYFTAIDKNGVERKFALDLKEYTLRIDLELCSHLQEIRKIVNPNNDIYNVFMDNNKTVYTLKNGMQFYYVKKKSIVGLYKVCLPKYDGKGKRTFCDFPLLTPQEMVDTKMYWEDEVEK